MSSEAETSADEQGDSGPRDQPQNPLHCVTLKAVLEDLVHRRGWEDLGQRINIRCFTHDPSMKSSLKFLRKTPWAREKVERLYVNDQRRWQRRRKASPPPAAEDPAERDPAERDPAERDPAERDPAERDSAERNSAGGDSADEARSPLGT